MTVGMSRLVSVKVESCFGSQPICSTRLPSFENATERFDDVVLLPMPPLPYTANTLALPILRLGSSGTCTLPSPSGGRLWRYFRADSGTAAVFMRRPLHKCLPVDLPIP